MSHLKKELFELLKKDKKNINFIPEPIDDQNGYRDLENQKNKCQRILEGIDVGTWEWNIQTNEIIYNEGCAAILGYALSELKPITNETFKQFKHPDDLEKSNRLLKDYFANKTTHYECETRIKHKDGHWIWVLDKGKIVSWTLDGKPEWMTGMKIEITKLKTTEEALSKSLSTLEATLESTADGILVVDNNGNITRFNKKFETLWRIPHEILVKKDDAAVLNFVLCQLKKPEHFLSKIKELYRQPEATSCDFIEFKDGRIFEHYSQPQLINGNTVGRVWSFRDITEQKKTLLAIAENENYLRTLTQASPESIAQFGSNREFIFMNSAGLALIEADNLEIAKEVSVFDLMYPEYHEPFISTLDSVLKGETGKLVFEMVGLKGTYRWLEAHYVPMKDINDNIISVLSFTQDITEGRISEISLLESQEKMQAIFDASLDAVIIIDEGGKIIKWDSKAENLFGWKEAEVIGTPISETIIPHDFRSAHHAGFNRFLTTGEGPILGKTIEVEALKKDNTQFDISLSISASRTKNKFQFIAFIRDITDRKVAQQHLKETLVKLESILDASSQVSIIGMDIAGKITSFNKGSENLLGYKKDEILLKHYSETIHLKTEIEARARELSKLLNQKTRDFNVFVALPNAGKYETREWTYVKKDGTRFPVQLTVTAIKNKNEIIGYLGVAADISEIKLLLEVTKDQNERLKNFSYIISHNLRSHSGNFSMLLNLLIEENPEIINNEIITMLLKSSENLNETINNLNEVVLIDNSLNENMTNLNLNHAIEATILNVTAIAKETKISIYNEVNPETTILGLPAYLDSILLNFITNSIKYRSLERKSYIKLKSFVEEEYIVLTVEDNGLGIDLDKNGKKLFGMYKTFHNNLDARGMGLFITKNQVDAMGGKIEVNSTVNQGTIFKIYFKNEKK